MDYSLHKGQKLEDRIQPAKSGKISRQILSNSNRPYVENCVLFAPTRVFCSYKLYGSVLPYDRSFVRAHQDSEAHRKRVAYRHNQNNSMNTIRHSRTNTINIIVNCHLIKYNVFIPFRPFSSS